MIKSISHATNLSTQPAKIISTGRFSSPPVFDGGSEPLFDEPTFLINDGIELNIYDGGSEPLFDEPTFLINDGIELNIYDFNV